MQKILAGLRPYLVFAGLFSLAMNLLLLAPPLYMLQVFDRVLTSRSDETLLVLSVAVAMALVSMASLDIVRAYLLAALGTALDRRLGPKVLDGLLGEAARLGSREHASARPLFDLAAYAKLPVFRKAAGFLVGGNARGNRVSQRDEIFRPRPEHVVEEGALVRELRRFLRNDDLPVARRRILEVQIHHDEILRQ